MFYQTLSVLPIKVGLRIGRPPPTSDVTLKDASVIWIDGLAEDSKVFCGEVRRFADITGVKPTRFAAYWLYRAGGSPAKGAKAKPGEKIVMHIHGGAFYVGSAHPDEETANIPRGLVSHSMSVERVLSVDYRLSATHPDPPANPFPAALLDSIAAYQYLVVEVGFDPQNIAVAGDSAGANIAFALVRHLVENSIPGLPPPGRLIGFSVWLDLSISRSTLDSSVVRNAKSDIFGTDPETRFDAYGTPAYLGPLDPEQAKTNRYLSPASPYIKPTEGLFRGFPRTFISAGGAEILLDDSMVTAERLKADGVDVTVDIVPDAVHDFLSFPWHEPERTDALKRICKWLDA
ncbi:hypothetical protein BN946_scf184785.g51 [Trametes cinnabarina]|uniref:Alpha/beta hydrolase fold-3 domain-containing protein n=1 Tax=Pycnoporus cinnabarinus TaxID=5643 RepID=A0A060S5R7_PYCCI|nr:hypothetical protein BN946_scf184785.g51 [Trametes cinnabarina]